MLACAIASGMVPPSMLTTPCAACQAPWNSRIVSPVTVSDADLTRDVFLSHSSEDKAVVRVIAERLRADGVRVWFDEWEIRPGDSIAAKIEEGLGHSRVLACPAVASGRRRMFCMSAHAFGSDWAQLEAGTFRFPRKPAMAKPLPRPRWSGRVWTIDELARQNPQ
jgi:hypothetical protein